MRITPFRTILHAVAYKLGLDPEQDNFLTNQAIPIGTYINQWVEREYSARDWPEWALTRQFSPDANHIVGWSPFTDSGQRVKIGRVLKVYLVDPTSTGAPVDTHYTLQDSGVHCGFDHGSVVWIRYLAPPPTFTAEQWDPSRSYKMNDVAYSYTSGEVYRSKVTGNIGHDPSVNFSPVPGTDLEPIPIQLDTEIIAPLGTGNPGLAAKNQIVDVTFSMPPSSFLPIPNPPPLNARFFVEVVDEDGALLGNATSMANGTDTLDLIMTDLSNQLISALSGFTSVTVDTTTFTIRIEDDSNFRVNQAYWGPFTQPNQNVPVRQIQSYVATVGATDSIRQVINFPLTDDQVTPGAEYQLTFKDVAGDDHIVTYTAAPYDSAQQVLSQLISATQAASDSDPFFGDVISQLDPVSPASQHATSTEISLNATMTLPGSAWWELVPFPSTIQNAVVRGAYADLLKEWSQTDKGTAEEGVVPQETQISVGDFTSMPNPELTGQQSARSRYKL